MQELELKRCPFCGSKEVFPCKQVGYESIYSVICTECDSEGSFSTGEDGAILAWNKRVPIVLYMKPNGLIFSRHKQEPDKEGWTHYFIEQNNGDFVQVSNGPPFIIDLGKQNDL